MAGVPKRLKIAVLVRNFVTTGGAERYAVEVTRRLAREHEVHVFAETWDETVCASLTMHRVPKYLGKPSFLNLLLFSRAVERMVDRRFDVIHSHERVKRCDVLTIHCPCFRGFITRQQSWLGKSIVWFSVITSPRSLSYLWLEKHQFDLEAARRVLIAVSKFVKADVQRNYQVPDDAFVIGYPGVEAVDVKDALLLEQASSLRRQYGIGPEDLAVLFVGTEFRRKGLDHLLRALARIKDPRIKLVVVGGGDVEKYQVQARALGIGERVVFAGLVRNVFPHYLLADIFVLPTLSDPCAMSPLEAMYCGVATVMSGTAYCGTAERIRDNEAILLQDPRNDEEIGQALARLLDREVRQELAAKGQRLARRLTWEETVNATVEAYARVSDGIARRSNGSRKAEPV
jgi:UDP-glucose:(heptosyl)LPS alpha-1,3-glucosyltransferase